MTIAVRAGAPISELDAPPAVHAFNNTTQSSITSTPSVGSPEVSVSFTAPSSGRVMVIVSGGVRSNGVNDRINIEVEIREDDSSGTVIQAPNRVLAGWTSSSNNTTLYQYGGRASLAPVDADGFIGALEPGRTYFARLLHRADTGGTGRDVGNRSLTVLPVPLGHVYGSPNELARASDRPRIQHVIDNTTQLNVTSGVAARNAGNPEVSLSFIAPNSGRALIVVGGGVRDNGSTGRIGLFPEVRVGSRTGPELIEYGSSIDGLSNYFRYFWSNDSFQSNNYQYGNAYGFLGSPATPALIPGQRYFARVIMVTSGGGTTDVFNRELYVVPLS